MGRVEPVPAGYVVIKAGREWVALEVVRDELGRIAEMIPLLDEHGRIMTKAKRADALTRLHVGMVATENARLKAELRRLRESAQHPAHVAQAG